MQVSSTVLGFHNVCTQFTYWSFNSQNFLETLSPDSRHFSYQDVKRGNMAYLNYFKTNLGGRCAYCVRIVFWDFVLIYVCKIVNEPVVYRLCFTHYLFMSNFLWVPCMLLALVLNHLMSLTFIFPDIDVYQWRSIS